MWYDYNIAARRLVSVLGNIVFRLVLTAHGIAWSAVLLAILFSSLPTLLSRDLWPLGFVSLLGIGLLLLALSAHYGWLERVRAWLPRPHADDSEDAAATPPTGRKRKPKRKRDPARQRRLARELAREGVLRRTADASGKDKRQSRDR
jgi:hypothetical protein